MTFTAASSGVPRSRSAGGADAAAAGVNAQADAPRAGDIIELGQEAVRYEIVRSLGTGGTAEVFLARRLGPAGFARPVALKCILAGLDVDESARRAFVYEARLASRLRHPNIAEAYDLGVVGDRYYLVLEYVDGVTVRAAMRAARALGRPLTEAFCCHVAASVADALHHAHALAGDDGQPLGIVHRDVTAVNVMVARSGVVKLLDFGVALARLEGRERTRTGQFRGTFVYASPEQAACEELDGRSDLFSLGVVLVEMLTGVRVFDAETDIGTMRRIAESSAEDVAAATAALPRDLAAICAKALARRPEDRFQDGEAFSRALRQYLTGRSVTYSPSECAAELRSLGLLDASVGSHAPQVPSDTSAAAAASTAAALDRQPAKAWQRFRVGALALLATASFAVAGTVVLVRRAPRHVPPPVAAPSPPSPARALAPGETGPGTAEARLNQPAASDMLSGAQAMVRPKQAAADGRAVRMPQRVPPAAVRRREWPAGTTSAEFVDRATVGSAEATLPRGTLVSVKLARPLAATNPGRADAIVTDEVSADGIVLVPKGSTVSCSARSATGGRIPLSCDRISTSDRVLRFTGVAVGEGQHVGLRLLDDEVAAGTPFVVYVSVPAALR